MSQAPLVSIIVPTMNSARTIERCLDSILTQTYSAIEIIVIDNNSIDGTVQKCLQKQARVYIKRMERSQSKNLGAKYAQGKYLLFFDSDMVAPPSLLEACARKVEDFALDACIIPHLKSGSDFWSRCSMVGDLLRKDDTENIAPRFVEKAVFLKIGGYDESLVFGEDKDLQIRLLKSKAKMAIMPLSVYEIGELSLSEMTRKSYYYGKSLPYYWRKNKDYAGWQLMPIRRLYLKNLNQVNNPALLIGFVLIKLIDYGSLFIGAIIGK